MSLKRSASPPLSQLTTESEVAIPESDTAIESTSSYTTLRRSKRLRVTVEKKEEEEDVPIAVPSLKGKKPRKRTTSTVIVPDVETKVSTDTSGSPAKRKGSASPRKQKPIVQALEVPHPTPAHWRETYDTIKGMRSRIPAPVDTMGCHIAQLKETTPENQRFATLVSLMLSSQTKDETTFTAVSRLREALGGSLNIDAIIEADESTISEAICKVGFWRRKRHYIKQTAQRLRDEFHSDVPKTVDELCSLPGVGPKMAFLALQDGWKLNAGIGVDVHVHRITNRLGWHKPPTKTPEQTRLNLESWLPLELHPEINALLVGFGQTVCLPVGPRCNDCELSSGLCPSARIVKPKKSKKAILSTASSSSAPKVEIALEEETKAEITGLATSDHSAGIAP